MERLMAFILEQQAKINARTARWNKGLNRQTEADAAYDRSVALFATIKHARKTRQMGEHLDALLKVVERSNSKYRPGKA